jgi:xylulokinase
MAALWVGLDVGTSGVKAIAVDGKGAVVARGEANYPIQGQGAIAEQDPLDYFNATVAAIGQLGAIEIAGIGICGQTPTLVLVDSESTPVTPAITWRDSRATAESEELKARFGRSLDQFGVDNVFEPSQLPAKLFWLSRNKPEALKKARWALLPKDYIALLLTSVAVSDPWSCKGLVSLKTRKPVADVLETIGITENLVPPQLDPWQLAGRVTRAGAQTFGVSESIPVAVGWSDALAGMVGIGAPMKAMSFILTGTSDIIGSSHNKKSEPVNGIYQVSSASSPLTIDFGPTQSSGGSLVWLAEESKRSVGELVELAASAETDAFFLPFIGGERAPLWNSQLCEKFIDLPANATLGEKALAVMKGVCLSDRHVLNYSWKSAGVSDEINLAGANIEHEAWLKARRYVFTEKLIMHKEPQLPALGAAMLAMSAATGETLVRAFEKLHGEIEVHKGVNPTNQGQLFARYLAAVDSELKSLGS